MPTLNDLWQAWLVGDKGQATTQLQARPALAAAENIAVTDRVNMGSGAKRLYSYNIFNPNTSVAFVQFFDFNLPTSAVLGTSVPVKQIAVPAGAVLDGTWDFGPQFTLGVIVAATTVARGATLVTTPLVISLGTI